MPTTRMAAKAHTTTSRSAAKSTARSPATLPRRSPRLLQPKTTTPDGPERSGLRRSPRFIVRDLGPEGHDAGKRGSRKMESDSLCGLSKRNLVGDSAASAERKSRVRQNKGAASDGKMPQGRHLVKKSSVPKLEKSISPFKVGRVKRVVKFDLVGDAKQSDFVGDIEGNSERRITRRLSASMAAQGAGEEVGVKQGDPSEHQMLKTITRQCSKSLLSVDISSGNNTQQVSGVSLRSVGELKGTDSTLVLEQEKYPLSRIISPDTGFGRKRKEMDDCNQGADSAWAKEQENALKKAYFSAKPTPTFWKKVAKLVGKSAQECFNKINSENPTPPLPHPRSRVKGKNLVSQFEVSFSETDLLLEKKRNIKGGNRPKGRNNQRVVRHLMRKQCEGDSNADLFSVLEPNANLSGEDLPSSPIISTPMSMTESGSSSCYGSGSLSSRKKSKSRFAGKPGILSPPILKPVKNMVLHDKYVDQLRAREAKRNAACNRKLARTQVAGRELYLKEEDAVKSAKESLISNARIAIEKFRDSEAYVESFDDSEEDRIDEEDESDIVL